MSTICSECGSSNIGYDAWVDKHGNVVGGPYDNAMCMDCSSPNVEEERDMSCLILTKQAAKS
jgi:hypothetical protein